METKQHAIKQPMDQREKNQTKFLKTILKQTRMEMQHSRSYGMQQKQLVLREVYSKRTNKTQSKQKEIVKIKTEINKVEI